MDCLSIKVQPRRTHTFPLIGGGLGPILLHSLQSISIGVTARTSAVFVGVDELVVIDEFDDTAGQSACLSLDDFDFVGVKRQPTRSSTISSGFSNSTHVLYLFRSLASNNSLGYFVLYYYPSRSEP